MKKKVLILAVIGLILIIVGSFLFQNDLLDWSSKKMTPSSSEKQKEEFNFVWEEWQDPAGFAFEYPTQVEINTHPEDETNYAYLELTAKDRDGKITIICNDSKYKDIEEWLEQDELVKEGSGLDTTVASMAAKKVAVENKELTAFIDWDQVIYFVEKDDGGVEFWKPVYNKILSSFRLIPLEGESEEEFANWLEGFPTEGVDAVEPVEIIE